MEARTFSKYGEGVCYPVIPEPLGLILCVVAIFLVNAKPCLPNVAEFGSGCAWSIFVVLQHVNYLVIVASSLPSLMLMTVR